MFSKVIIAFLITLLFNGCNLREDDSLPANISPFEIIEEAIYITQSGNYATAESGIYLQVEVTEPTGFSFVEESYHFDRSSDSFSLKLIDESGNQLTDSNLFPLIALPSVEFDYLGLKFLGEYERFYPYPRVNNLSGYGGYYENGYCYFILSDAGYYQTVSEATSQQSITIQVNSQSDVNASLYQAQFILPQELIPSELESVTLSKNKSSNLAQYELIFQEESSDLILANPDAVRYPILYLPVEPGTEMTSLSLKQILPTGNELLFHYNPVIEEHDQFTTYGNCLIVLVNNAGKFIINNNNLEQ